MTTVTVYTAERMAEIEAQAVVGAEVVDNHLIMSRFNETTFDAGVIDTSGGSRSVKQVVIASSEANDNSKSTADLICSGVDDQVQFLAAIDMLTGDDAWGQGGEILLTEGTFYLDLTIESLPIQYITLRGVSKHNTYLEIQMDGVGLDCMNCTIEDLYIFGAGTSAHDQFVVCTYEVNMKNVIIWADSDDCALFVQQDDNIFRDCEFHADTSRAADVSGKAFFDNCRFIALGGYPARVYASYLSFVPIEMVFKNCVFWGYGSQSCFFIYEITTDVHGSNILIDGCTFAADSATLYGIQTVDGAVGGYTTLNVVNSVFTTPSGDATCAMVLDGDPGAHIANNRVIGYSYAMDIVNCPDAKVIGNHFQGWGATAITVSASHRAAFENNTFHGFVEPLDVSPAVASQVGLAPLNCDELFIVNNQFHVVGTHVLTLATCNRAMIMGNQFWRCGLQTDNTFSAIKLTTSDDCAVLNNFATSSGNSVKLKYALEILAGCDRTYVRGNQFYDSADTAPILDSGTSTDTTSANKVS